MCGLCVCGRDIERIMIHCRYTVLNQFRLATRVRRSGRHGRDRPGSSHAGMVVPRRSRHESPSASSAERRRRRCRTYTYDRIPTAATPPDLERGGHITYVTAVMSFICRSNQLMVISDQINYLYRNAFCSESDAGRAATSVDGRVRGYTSPISACGIVACHRGRPVLALAHPGTACEHPVPGHHVSRWRRADRVRREDSADLQYTSTSLCNSDPRGRNPTRGGRDANRPRRTQSTMVRTNVLAALHI
jgi:hypothetical protein